jgi:hypothetical protein
MTENNPVRARLKIAVSAAALFAAMVLTVQYITLARQDQKLKTDLAEINYIRYSLLNADEWSDQLTHILSIKILEFNLTPESRVKLVQNLENIFYQLIDDVELMMKAKTSVGQSGIKGLFSGFTINLDPFRDSVPSYANQLLDELNKPGNKAFLQQFLSNKLNVLASSTYNLDTMDPLHEVMDRYNCVDKDECRELIQEKIDLKNKAIKLRVILVMLLVCVVFLINLITRKKLNVLQATILIIATFCLLLGGITTPMIDLEARIDHLMIQLMGEQITFHNNIIFFQSKSISDVVRILLEDGRLPMIFVGILVFTFSIIFPSAKLISSLLYTYRIGKLRENRVIQFFAVKSGKWSMADVMVVAIFMAYIGFSGIISNQLDLLTESAKPVQIFTTNGTQLLEGFYLFLLFCVSSLILSEIIPRKT